MHGGGPDSPCSLVGKGTSWGYSEKQDTPGGRHVLEVTHKDAKHAAMRTARHHYCGHLLLVLLSLL